MKGVFTYDSHIILRLPCTVDRNPKVQLLIPSKHTNGIRLESFRSLIPLCPHRYCSCKRASIEALDIDNYGSYVLPREGSDFDLQSECYADQSFQQLAFDYFFNDPCGSVHCSVSIALAPAKILGPIPIHRGLLSSRSKCGQKIFKKSQGYNS